MLKQLGMGYQVKDGLLTITSLESLDEEPGDRPRFDGSDTGFMAGFGGMGMGGMGGMGMAGMGGTGLSLEQAQAAGGALLNRAAASDQARGAPDRGQRGRDGDDRQRSGPAWPSRFRARSHSLAQRSAVARCRPGPVACRVLREGHTCTDSARVYRLAKLTNQSDLVSAARRGDRLRRQRLRGPDEPAPGGCG